MLAQFFIGQCVVALLNVHCKVEKVCALVSALRTGEVRMNKLEGPRKKFVESKLYSSEVGSSKALLYACSFEMSQVTSIEKLEREKSRYSLGLTATFGGLAKKDCRSASVQISVHQSWVDPLTPGLLCAKSFTQDVSSYLFLIVGYV